MSVILAIETATEACSAALLKSDSDHNIDKLFVRFEHAPREHTKLVLPMLEEVLDQASIKLNEVDAIAFGCGPGAFTGLRIAAGIAQGVALSVDKPVIPVSTLAALAQQVILSNEYNNETIIVALDARMGEVYWGKFHVKDGIAELIGEEQVSNPGALLDCLSNNPETESTIGLGSGWDVYAETLLSNSASDAIKYENLRIIQGSFPSAEFIAQLALPRLINNHDVLAPEDAQPVYIRNNVAKKSQKV